MSWSAGRVQEASGKWRPFLDPERPQAADAMSLQNHVWWRQYLGEKQIVARTRAAMAGDRHQ